MQYKEIRVGEKVKRAINAGRQVFSVNWIKRVESNVGDLAMLKYGDSFLAWATLNPLDPYHYVRLLSTDEKYEPLEDLKDKIRRAKDYRSKIGYKNHYRLVYSESDFLSGLIIDKYNDIYVIQNANPFFDKNIEILRDALIELEGKNISIIEKSVGKSRETSRLEPRERILYGELYETTIKECNKKFVVNVLLGQKTGWFLDQRENRKIISKIRSEKAIDVFCYTGSFGICSNSDQIFFVEKNKYAVNILKKNISINRINNYKIFNDNAFKILKMLANRKEKFDLVILDPPDLLSEKNGLKNIILINSMAIDLIDEGFLATFSCSQDLKEERFLSILRTIIRRKRKRFSIIGKFQQAFDHKVIHPHRELNYLKGFLLEIHN
ncbi:class I SAM-dependent rRNA methyltransferase [Nanoarchaeota archaeon NZ13-N]|nr:MAG: class I SAM-dependent rRNA methyltransferase [Nanoarchaeota archaeon NZ13-N]